MTAVADHYYLFAAEALGRPKDTPRDNDLSVAILTELVQSSDAYLSAKADGIVTTLPSHNGLTVLFKSEGSAPLVCVLTLVGILQELPMIAVRIALHAGAIESGVEEVQTLLKTGRAGQILVSPEFASALGGAVPIAAKRLVLLESGDASAQVADELAASLEKDGHSIAREKNVGRDLAWAKSVEERIRSADSVIVIVTGGSAKSELLQYQLEMAVDERRVRGRPQIVPVWLGAELAQEGRLASLQQNSKQIIWQGPEDMGRVADEVRAAIADGQEETDTDRLDTASGVRTEIDLRRPINDEFERALADHESIVLVKGPRQIGKSALLETGVQFVDDQGWRCATTDFQRLSSRQMNREASFYRVLASTLCRQVGFECDLDEEWLDEVSPTLNMDNFMRQLLKSSDRPLVWFMDEADRLFSAPFASDFYGLVRSWYNARATDWKGPWGRLTVVIGYATEVHLFVKDVNLSPFNVGHRIEIPMFSLEDTMGLNQRSGSPIQDRGLVGDLQSLLGGHPFLTHRAFELLSSGRTTVAKLLREADQDDGPFSDHLKRILVSVSQLSSVREALAQSLTSLEIADSDGLQRLVSAGILVRSGREYELVCELYRRYLARQLKTGAA